MAAPARQDVLADMANALSTDNPRAFLKNLLPELAREIQPSIEELCARYDITSSIDILGQDELGMEVDWYLELKERSDAATVLRRRERVKVVFAASSKQQKVSVLQPREFFAVSR